MSYFIPKRTVMALEAVLHIACHAGDAPVSSKSICAYFGVTQRYLEQLLQGLVKAQLLKSVRGPKGGYVLARERRKITLLDIHHAVENPADEARENAVLHTFCTQADAVMCNYLAGLTLQTLCEQAVESGVALPPRPDFTI